MPDVCDAVQDHREAVETQAKGEAGHSGGMEKIVAANPRDGFEYGGINHSAAGNLNPLRLLSPGLEFDVDLITRFREGEVVRPKTELGVAAKDFLEEEFQGAFEVGDADVAVD